MKNDKAVKTSKFIEQCIWKTDEFGDPDKSALKSTQKSPPTRKRANFWISWNQEPCLIAKRAATPITIAFSAKDRRLSEYLPRLVFLLSDSDHEQLYFAPDRSRISGHRFANLLDIERPRKATVWCRYLQGAILQVLLCQRRAGSLYPKVEGPRGAVWFYFHPITGTPMDELFTRYMYYERAKQGIKSSTTEALRKFYERNAYSLLKDDQTFEIWSILQISGMMCRIKMLSASLTEFFAGSLFWTTLPTVCGPILFRSITWPIGIPMVYWTTIVSIAFLTKSPHSSGHMPLQIRA